MKTSAFQNLFRDSAFATILKEHPITFYDVGARGGFDADLWPIAFGVNAVGFEPDPEEFSRMQLDTSSPWMSSKILPHAVGDANGKRTLHIPSEPEGASLLPPITDLPEHLNKRQYFDIQQTVEVDTATLDDIVKLNGEAAPDCLKIDIEGLELDVLRSSPGVMKNLLAVKMEVAFVELRQNQPTAHQINSFMSEQGFSLMDLIRPAHWRTTGYVVHPHMGQETVPYSRGQLIQGDYLFFRNIDGVAKNSDSAVEQIIKLLILAMSYGYFDFAAGLLKLDILKTVMPEQKINELATSLSVCSRRYGRCVARAEFLHHLRLLGPYFRRFHNIIWQ
jgi:FkbM family methyltransferase